MPMGLGGGGPAVIDLAGAVDVPFVGRHSEDKKTNTHTHTQKTPQNCISVAVWIGKSIAAEATFTEFFFSLPFSARATFACDGRLSPLSCGKKKVRRRRRRKRKNRRRKIKDEQIVTHERNVTGFFVTEYFVLFCFVLFFSLFGADETRKTFAALTAASNG